MGRTVKAIRRATPYSKRLICANPNAWERPGRYRIMVDSTRLPNMAPHKMKLWEERENTLPLWLLILKEWIISAMLMVRKAIVIPSWLCAISHTPLSI